MGTQSQCTKCTWTHNYTFYSVQSFVMILLYQFKLCSYKKIKDTLQPMKCNDACYVIHLCDTLFFFVLEDRVLEILLGNEHQRNWYPCIFESLLSKWNTKSENRTWRLVVIAPGFWHHSITLAMRHQHQLLLCLLVSQGPASAVWVNKMCPPSLAQTRNTWGPSHGRQAADQGHVCMCVLVAIVIASICRGC